MKNIIFSLMVLFFVVDSVSAQPKQKQTPIYVMRSRTSDLERIFKHVVMGTSQIESLEVMSNDEVKKRFGDPKSFLVLIVRPKISAELTDLKGFLISRNIDPKEEFVCVSVDGQKLQDLESLLIDKNSVKEVSIKDHSLEILTQNQYKKLQLNNIKP